ncbi:ImmA/IrrE family metallo-endopeptidase [Kribbella sp. NPDC051770]|uniref:ImmA/IrrE family metallo-endopeptidase n=1 Tax=Kribbella sp. NPDC051770 TaxID=3155413 RepID=UPI003448D172
MRRGFKAEAERTSTEVRVRLGIGKAERLPLELLASSLGAELRSAGDLIDIARLEEIERIQPGAFSACTFEIGERHVVVWNPLSTPGRISSDIAHELSHLLLKHSVQQVETVGDLTFFGCDPDEEQEANWLAGCLLLPRALLVVELRKRATADSIADKYQVSTQMANHRLRASGAMRQVLGH